MDQLLIMNVFKLLYGEHALQVQITTMKRKLIGWRMATQAKMFTVDTPFIYFRVDRDGNILNVKRRDNKNNLFDS